MHLWGASRGRADRGKKTQQLVEPDRRCLEICCMIQKCLRERAMTTVTQSRSSFFFLSEKSHYYMFLLPWLQTGNALDCCVWSNQPWVNRILFFRSYFHREVKSQTRSRKKQPWGSARLLMTEMPREAGRLSRTNHLSERMFSASTVEEENRRNTAVASGLRRQFTQGAGFRAATPQSSPPQPEISLWCAYETHLQFGGGSSVISASSFWILQTKSEWNT